MRCDHHPFDEEIAYLRHGFPRATRGKPCLCELRRGKPRICFPASTAFRFDVIPSRMIPPALDGNPPMASPPSVKFDPQNILNTLPWQEKNRATRLMAKLPLLALSFLCPLCSHNPTMVAVPEPAASGSGQRKTPPRRPATAGVFGAEKLVSVRVSACRRRAVLPAAGGPTEPAESAGDTSRSSA